MRRDDQQEIDREKQQARIDAQHQQEAAARPNSLHRVLIWLLRQTAANNRDTAREANYYIDLLDRELADQTALDALQVETAAPAAIAQTPAGGGIAPAPTFDTATSLRTSRRFSKANKPDSAAGAAAVTKAAVKKAVKTGQPIPVKQSSRFRK